MSSLRRSPASVFLAQSFLGNLSLATALTLASVYAITDAGLGAFQLILVGVFLEASVLLFEVPTGVVADVFGRRRSILIGTALIGVSFILWGLVPALWAILLAQVGWGLGYTFRSGAVQAWLADEVGEVEANRLFLRGSQTALAGAFAGTLAAIALGSISLGLPLIVGGAGHLVVVILLLIAMPEHGFSRVSHVEGGARRSLRSSLRAPLRDAVALVRSRPVIGSILAIAVLHGAASETMDRLWELRLLEEFTFPTIGPLDGIAGWFGAINLVSMVLAIVATEIVRRRIDPSSHRAVTGVLMALQLSLIVSIAVFASAPVAAVALSALWAYWLVRDIVAPLSEAWLNQHLESSSRATVFSFAGQADALGQLAGGPLLGLVAASAGTPAAILASALVLVPSLLLYARARRQGDGTGDGPVTDDGPGAGDRPHDAG